MRIGISSPCIYHKLSILTAINLFKIHFEMDLEGTSTEMICRESTHLIKLEKEKGGTILEELDFFR